MVGPVQPSGRMCFRPTDPELCWRGPSVHKSDVTERTRHGAYGLLGASPVERCPWGREGERPNPPSNPRSSNSLLAGDP